MIKILQESIPLQRASMRLRLTLPTREARHVREKILQHLTIQQEDWESHYLIIVSSHYQPLYNETVCVCVCVCVCDIGVFDGSRVLSCCR